MNPNHPIIKAMNKRKLIPPHQMPMMPEPREFDLTPQDVPGLEQMQVGDPIEVSLKGTLIAPGKMSVDSVETDSAEGSEQQDPGKSVPVMTQESHT